MREGKRRKGDGGERVEEGKEKERENEIEKKKSCKYVYECNLQVFVFEVAMM